MEQLPSHGRAQVSPGMANDRMAVGPVCLLSAAGRPCLSAVCGRRGGEAPWQELTGQIYYGDATCVTAEMAPCY